MRVQFNCLMTSLYCLQETQSHPQYVTVCNSLCVATLASTSDVTCLPQPLLSSVLCQLAATGAGERAEGWRACLPRTHRGLGSIPGAANKTEIDNKLR